MSNGEKRTVSGFEKFVFSVTRVFALCGVAIVVIGIVILGMNLFSLGENTKVTYSEVVNQMAATARTSNSDTETATIKPAMAIPNDIKPYFDGENESALRTWIEDLSEAQQKDFLDNMAQVCREAKANKTNPVDTINTYKTLKLKKLSSNEFDKYTAIATKAGYIAGILGLLLILSILSLVLVMLAIERNTRPLSA